MNFKIGNREIGPGNPAYIIAEMKYKMMKEKEDELQNR